ncbi:GreA/GreB family elongation factor [Sphingomonas sp. GCM10030256]|uniref:GreA/GreB family elongation factor n=1 Tax=Sphingomonas sp. GCM10030256 TaxID=3273427 RepID=UPI00361D0DBF
MSVAFRRESDEEHLEPKFELPIPPGPNLVTPRGLSLIEARVSELEARLTDPLSEEERSAVKREARYWRARQASAQLIAAPTGEQVAIGCRVTYQREGQSRTIEIVGHDESEPATDRVGFTAPLVRAMLGAQVGDEIDLPGGHILTIIAVEPSVYAR